MHKTELLGVTLAGIILLSACSSASQPSTLTLKDILPAASTPTITPSPMPTMTPTPDYSIDVDKLYGIKDFNDVLADPDICVMAPPIEKIDELNKWLNNDLRPLLKSGKNNPNITESGFEDHSGIGAYLMRGKNNGEISIIGEPAIFCTKYKDTIYPVVVMTVNYNGGNEFDTFALVLSTNRRPETGELYGGADNIKDMYNSNKIRALMIIVSPATGQSEVTGKLLELGSVAFDPMAYSFNGIKIGPGELLMPSK